VPTLFYGKSTKSNYINAILLFVSSKRNLLVCPRKQREREGEEVAGE
jgi:hypothetical protein